MRDFAKAISRQTTRLFPSLLLPRWLCIATGRISGRGDEIHSEENKETSVASSTQLWDRNSGRTLAEVCFGAGLPKGGVGWRDVERG